MRKLTETYVTGRLNRFVVLYQGLAHWFDMKDQYLYRISVEQEFYDHVEELKASGETREKFIYHHLDGSIVTPKLLAKKRRWYAMHAVNEEGYKRIGVELLPEYQALYGTEPVATRETPVMKKYKEVNEH